MRTACKGLFATVLLFAVRSSAQVVRLNSARIVRPDVSSGSMSMTATPAIVNFTLAPGSTALGSSPVTITTNVSGLTLLGTFSIYGYFATTNALTTTGGDKIPVSAVLGRCPTGTPTTFTAFTQTSPFSAGSSLLIFQSSSLAGLVIGGNLTETLYLEINLSGLPQQPAGNYSGTLILQAQAF